MLTDEQVKVAAIRACENLGGSPHRKTTERWWVNGGQTSEHTFEAWEALADDVREHYAIAEAIEFARRQNEFAPKKTADTTDDDPPFPRRVMSKAEVEDKFDLPRGFFSQSGAEYEPPTKQEAEAAREAIREAVSAGDNVATTDPASTHAQRTFLKPTKAGERMPEARDCDGYSLTYLVRCMRGTTGYLFIGNVGQSSKHKAWIGELGNPALEIHPADEYWPLSELIGP